MFLYLVVFYGFYFMEYFLQHIRISQGKHYVKQLTYCSPPYQIGIWCGRKTQKVKVMSRERSIDLGILVMNVLAIVVLVGILSVVVNSANAQEPTESVTQVQ